MVNRLPTWVFLSLAMVLMGLAILPVLRAMIGIDESIQMQFLTVISLLIAGLMCGLTAMLLLARRQPKLKTFLGEEEDRKAAAQMHATGLLIITGIPLLNFLACYYLWIQARSRSRYLDNQGREAICFQITIYLYLLVSLFMAYLIIGVFAILLLIAFQVIASLVAVVAILNGKNFRYPANIAIIERGLEVTEPKASA